MSADCPNCAAMRAALEASKVLIERFGRVQLGDDVSEDEFAELRRAVFRSLAGAHAALSSDAGASLLAFARAAYEVLQSAAPIEHWHQRPDGYIERRDGRELALALAPVFLKGGEG